MRSMLLKVTALAAAVAAFLLLGVGQALATHVNCGDVITQDTTLDSDLTDCSGSGLVIGGDDITLDLNGHTIDGPDPPYRGFDPGIDGVGNRAGHDGLVVRNGTITEFFTGVRLGASSSNITLSTLTIGAQNGVQGPMEDSRVEDVVIRSQNFGMLVGGARMVIRGNTLEAPVPRRFGASMVLSGPVGSLVERNRVTGGGIYVNFGQGNLVSRNLASQHLDVGIFVSGNGNLVERNVLTETSTGIIVGSGENTIERNEVLASSGDGMRVEGGNSLVIRNTLLENRSDGLEIRSAATRVAKNTADRNRDWGIAAVSGTVDLGGNKASGNGNPLQCLNVECK